VSPPEHATREDLAVVTATVIVGLFVAGALAIGVGLWISETVGTMAGAGILFGLIAHLKSSERGKRVGRTPISAFLRSSSPRS
jgi:uncharacterized membrane protein YiaA